MTWAQFKATLEARGVKDDTRLDELHLVWRDDDDDGPYSFAIEITHRGARMWNS